MQTIPLHTNMKLAIYTGGYLPEKFRVPLHTICQQIKMLAVQETNHQFILIGEALTMHQFEWPGNCTVIELNKPPRFVLSKKNWHHRAVQQIIRREKPDIMLASFDGFYYRFAIPLLLWLNDLSFLEKELGVKKRLISGSKKLLQKNLAKANAIIVTTHYLQSVLEQQMQIPTSKIHVIQPLVDASFSPVDINEKMKIKNELTQHKEYFMVVAAYYNDALLIDILKTYSVFKKRQLSGMKLLLVLQNCETIQSFKKIFSTYKYRNDVLLKINPSVGDMQKWISAAYGIVYPVQAEIHSPFLLEAMQMAVPLMAYPTTINKELAGAAALYADEMAYTALADKMMLLYKDESLKAVQVQKGLEQLHKRQAEADLSNLWGLLQHAVG
ncbi:MAG TPA: glycosyltransferase [Chitinophagaceae bacterium]|nr:glycosyltransferase [Chitinophagaceae bacterium]